jgi:hypothetical protein
MIHWSANDQYNLALCGKPCDAYVSTRRWPSRVTCRECLELPELEQLLIRLHAVYDGDDSAFSEVLASEQVRRFEELRKEREGK